ncbi:MAG: hypothetical protein LUH14_10680 [Clostridiaceae bacterium]|nr:hypothetical protein [Clostridiaceae bacterium]
MYYFVFCAVCIVHILSIYNRIVDFEFLKKMIVGISMFASICVILQTLVYYSLGFHIQMMSVSFISSGLEGYDTAFRMGMGSSGGMYRPSAFFFEPAHFCQYAVVGLLMALYHYAKGKTSIKYSILISFGMICTTSSQGLVFMLLAWVWGIYVKRGNMTTKMFRIIVILTLLILAVGICYVTGLFHVDSIINRVIGTVDGYNAIAGRNFANELYLSQLSGKSLLWGVGYVNRPDVYMTGIVVYRYTIGYIGCALFYLALLFSVRKIDRISFAVAVAYGGLLCVASATSVVSFIFYMGITYSELKEIKTEGRSRKISVKFRRKFDSL